MNNNTNESDEAYERRMAIKALMEAPRGSRFEFSDNAEFFGFKESIEPNRIL